MSVLNKLKSLLFEAGLSEAEVVLYLELFKKPANTVWELKERTGFSKSAVYRAVDRLESLKMLERSQQGIKALSLKALVAELGCAERKAGKLAYKIRQIAPFLRVPDESVEEFEPLYTQDQILDAYIFMSELRYGCNFDLGDFEDFISKIGGLEMAKKFLLNRMKHAKNYAILKEVGEVTEYFVTEKAKREFNNKVDALGVGLNGNFIIFSDTSDYVMFNRVSGSGDLSSVLVKSKPVADAQRVQFDCFSRQFGNF